MLDLVPSYVEAGIFGAVSALILLFIWNLICAPYRIERDAHNETKKKLKEAERIYKSRPLNKEEVK